MLPCNVVVQEAGDGRTEVSAIDPVASMMAIDNPALIIYKIIPKQVRYMVEWALEYYEVAIDE